MSIAPYSDLAQYYDQIYHWKNYAEEAGVLRTILASEGVTDGESLADVSCGTGSHLKHLAEWYSTRGYDSSHEMLQIARRKLPGVELLEQDMAAAAVQPPTSAILCLFSAFGYLLSDASIDRAILNFAAGLRPGGILILEPWLGPDEFRPGTAAMHTFDSPDLKLCRSVVTRREGDVSVLEFHWLIAAAGSPGVDHQIEEHRLRLLPIAELLHRLTRAGFAPSSQHLRLTEDRALVVARRG